MHHVIQKQKIQKNLITHCSFFNQGSLLLLVNYYASAPDKAFIPPTALGTELIIIAALVAYAGRCMKPWRCLCVKFMILTYNMTRPVNVRLQILVDSAMKHLFLSVFIKYIFLF